VAEAALAHTNRDKVEAAYRRSDLFEQRTRMMGDWATFCCQSASNSKCEVMSRASHEIA